MSRRTISALVTVVLVAALAALPIAAPAASAAPATITVGKSAPASVLVGNTIPTTLSASNASGNPPVYNVSFRDVLPLGVTYVPGSTSPADVGDPLIFGDGTTVAQTLVWRDTVDLQPGATSSLTFSVRPDPATYPVARPVTNTATGYASTQPRYVPKFDAAGAPVSDPRVVSATSPTVQTKLTAITIKKSEPSPEHDVLRGVHDHPTTYTLKVTNNPLNATNAVVVTDYLPAEFEFLGCGAVDNTAGGAVEYPGAARLSANPTVPGCVSPTSVSTVANPSGYPAGVYTQVVWTIGNLTPGQVITLPYQAGIPLRKNVLFPAGTATTGVQAANLSNNTGAPTRQNGPAAVSTNYAHVAGNYQGPVFAGGSQQVTDDDSLDVTVNDVRIHKSVSPATFLSGQIAKYTLTVDVGEYETASNIVVTDTVPNGVCPLGPSNYTTGTPADCDPVPGDNPSQAYTSVTQNADGTFTVVFSPIANIAADGTTQVVYYGRMRTTYTGGTLAGEPTSAGDSFTNKAKQVGDTTPIPPNGVDTGTLSVTDPTSATQGTDAPQLTKQIGERAKPMSCSSATYRGLLAPIPPALTFAAGDRVCFRVTVSMASDADARNPVVTDFLPDNVTYEASSMTPGPQNTVPVGEFGFDESAAQSAGTLTWTVGHTTPGNQREVTKGSVFQADFSAIVTGVAAGPAPDKTGNLAKYRQVDSGGNALSLRDGVDFAVADAPIAVVKGVASVNGTVYNPAGDGKPAVEGDQVTYHIDVTNNSDATAAPPAQTISAINVWDVLPFGFTCAAVARPIADSGACTDPGDPAQPSFAGNDKRSAIVWTSGVTLAPGQTHTYAYTVTVPANKPAGADLVNNASVRSYETSTDISGTTQTHYPAQNVDTSLPGTTTFDPKPATDPSDIVTPAVAVTKQVDSAIAETNNVGGTPGSVTIAVPGESVSYVVVGRVPAHTTVFNATFSDPVPTGLAVDSVVADFAPDASTPTYGAVPSGVVLSGTTLTFPATYDNSTATDQLFRLRITVHVDAQDTTRNVQGAQRVNTATFTSGPDPDGGAAPAPQSATATTAIAEPVPTLTKTNNVTAPATVAEGSVVTYTLRAGDSAGRPPLHDAWVVDCLPSQLTFLNFTSPSGSAASTKPGSAASTTATGCATGTTEIDWSVGDLAPGAISTLTYTARVNPGAVGGVSYTNRAGISGNSLAGARSAPTDPGAAAGRSYTRTSSSSVTVASATVSKTVLPTNPTIGQQITYVVRASLPANVNFYNLSVIDTLPTGIAPVTTPPPAVAACTNPDATSCSITTATPLAGSGQNVGWLLGDIAASPVVRTVSLTYTAKVSDVPAAFAGKPLSNSAVAAWNTNPTPPPTSAGATFDRTTSPGVATATVREPLVSIAKTVDNATPAPGDTVTYTVTASNATGVNVSNAYNVTLRDAVPAGVVVQSASISDGGTLSGADPVTGGGTITWTLPGPIAPGASKPLTYSATLAPSTAITAAGLRNTATLTGYDSLASGGRHYSPGSTANALVTPRFPHLVAAKAATDGPITYVGTHYRWTFTITNDGTATAVAVGASDDLPPNWTFDAGSATVSVAGSTPAAVTPSTSTAASVQTLTFTGLATLAPGQTATVTYTATPGAGVPSLPGVGHVVDQRNAVTPTGTDATGATGNAAGSYSAGPAAAITHVDSADLTLTKSAGPRPVAGRTGTWTLSVANVGPDPAVGPFTVTDAFDNPPPSGVTVTDVSGTGWTCSTGPITCTRAGSLASGSSFPSITITYSVSSDVTDGTPLDNSATVDAHTYDPDRTNNTGQASTTVTTGADLGLTKRLTSGAVVPGATATYALTLTNYGPSVSHGPISVADTLPPGSTLVSTSGSGWTCPAQPSNGVLTCTRGDLAPGGTAPDLVVTVRIPADQTADVVNTATATGTTPEGTDNHPNTDTVTTTPEPSADLEIAKVLNSPPLVAGATASYDMTVVNHGPSDAHNVSVTDSLPSTLTPVRVDNGAAWDCMIAGQDVTCDLGAPGTLAAGASASFTLVVRVGQFRTPISNTAVVHSTTADPVPGNNSSTSNGDAIGRADLSIVKSHSGTVIAGAAATFTLQVTNHGPSDEAGPITVSDVLPAAFGYVSADGAGWTCDYDVPSRTVTCTGAGGLGSGADAPAITVQVLVATDAGPARITNTATVAGNPDSPDPVPGNNSSADQVDVTVVSNVTLDKTLETATPVVAGTDATFTLTVTNNGPSDATSLIVTDTLPQYLTYASAVGSGWTCDHTGQDVVCTRPRLTAGAGHVATITVVAHTDPAAPGGMTVDNVATVGKGSPGTTTQPNPVHVPLARSADLATTKHAVESSVTAGDNVTWAVTVHNNGPSDAAGPITVTDTLPVLETFVTSSGIGWMCTATTPTPGTAQVVTCTRVDPLAVGGTDDTLRIVASVDVSSPVGTQQNAAVGSSGTPDPDHSNDTGTATVPVGRAAHLTITKTHVGTAAVGAALPFVLTVHNAGPSTADQVVVTDTLPTGLSFASAEGNGWTCTPDGQVVTCRLAGTIAPTTDAALLTIFTTVRAAAYPSATNSATVTSDDPDLPGSDTATDTVPVPPDAQLGIVKRALGTFAVGGSARYALVLTNHGPTANPGPVVVTDHLPAGLRATAASGNGWQCTVHAAVVTCTRATGLAVHASSIVTITVDVLAAAYPSVANTASATGPGSQPTTGSTTTPVHGRSILQVTKTLDGVGGPNGDIATYTVTVQNIGPNPTEHPIVILDPLPTGLEFVDVHGAGSACTAAGRTVRCVHDASVPVGATISVTLQARITAAPGTTVVNVASASSGNSIDSSDASNPVPVTRAPSPPASPIGATPAPPGTGLASTGVAAWEGVELALLLVAGGALALVLGTRRRRRD